MGDARNETLYEPHRSYVHVYAKSLNEKYPMALQTHFLLKAVY